MRRRWPVLLSIVVALGLAAVPLPGPLEIGRPDWVALTLVYWALNAPRRVGLGTAWLAGLALDTLKGALLGQHALALSVVVFIALKFHLRIRVFPIWQQAATVFSLLAIYQFILFWIDGVAGAGVPGYMHWTPVVIDAMLWPLLVLILRRIQRQIEVGGATGRL